MALVPALDLRPPSNDVAIPHAPANLEAEQALLGAILYDNAAFERIGDNLQPRHFFEPFHQRLYAAIEGAVRKGQLADPLLLAEQFARDAGFEELGGVRYLAALVDRAPPAANAPDYARAVYDLALRRDLIRIGGEISLAAAEGDPELSARDQIEAAEAHSRDGGLAGLSTGFIDLDAKIGGLHPSDLVIIAARPSMGKSALASNIGFDVAKSYAWEPQPDGGRKTVRGG